MSKSYRCDHCTQEMLSAPNVILNGVSGRGGGILLPETFTEKHFCGPECFWRWCKENMPDFLRVLIHDEVAWA